MGHNLSLWARSTLAGFLAVRDGAPSAAAAHWREALALAQQDTGVVTPFHAVALSTLLAVAAPDDRAVYQAAAFAAWDGVAARIAQEDMPLPARSSAFHLRLAGRHAEAFALFLRRRAAALADLGRFIAQANAFAGSGQATALHAHLATYDPAAALSPAVPLPAVLDEAVRIARNAPRDAKAPIGRADAARLLASQISDIRSCAAAPLPTTLAAELEASLGFCAFAPLLAALSQGASAHTTEFDT